MYSFCLIGMTEEGKSRYARMMISEHGMQNFGCLVNDINGEYGETRRDRRTGESVPSLNLPTDTNLYRSRYVHPERDGKSMRAYMDLAWTKKNTTIIYEECTAFFKGRTPADLCELIISKGHTYCNHVFLFHSIRSVPPELLGLMDFVVLFKTGDNEDIVKQKDQKLLPYWLVLQNKPKGHPPFKIEWQREAFDGDAYKKLRNAFFNTQK